MHYSFTSGFKNELLKVEESRQTKSSEVNLRVVPNPSSTKITISMENVDTQEILIYNSQMKLMDSKKSIVTFDISNYPPGIYFVKVLTSRGNSLNTSFIKV